MNEIEAKVSRLAEQVKKLEESDRMKQTQIQQLQTRCEQLEKMKNACTCKEQCEENNITPVSQGQEIPITVTEPAPMLSAFEDLHDEVLRDNLPRMVDDMELQRTDLLNELIEDDVISSDEGSTIRKSGNRHAQTRTLASIISRQSSNKFEAFLKRLGERNNYPPVAKTIMESYKRKQVKYWKSRSKPGSCFPCSVIKKVNLEDVVDMLLKHGVVDWDFLDQIRESKNPTSVWMHVFKRIDGARNRLEFINCLRMALNRKHHEIAEMLNEGYPHSLNCYCKLQSSAACLEFTETSGNCLDYCSSSGYIVTSSEDTDSILSSGTMNTEFTIPQSNNESTTPPAKKARKSLSRDVVTTSKSLFKVKRLQPLHHIQQSSHKVAAWLSKTKRVPEPQPQEKRKTRDNYRAAGVFNRMPKRKQLQSSLNGAVWLPKNKSVSERLTKQERRTLMYDKIKLKMKQMMSEYLRKKRSFQLDSKLLSTVKECRQLQIIKTTKLEP